MNFYSRVVKKKQCWVMTGDTNIPFGRDNLVDGRTLRALLEANRPYVNIKFKEREEKQ